MYQGYRSGAVLLMGGAGVRFGRAVPKQFCNLGGKPLWRHSFEVFLEMEIFDEIVVVCHQDWMGRVKEANVVRGGATRQESSRLGLSGFRERPEIVVIHDAARPFVKEKTILENLDAAIKWEAADTCIPTADTLVYAREKGWIESIPNREEFLRAQTPQTFRYDLIVEAHERARKEEKKNASDDCQLVLAMGKRVAVVRGTEENLKITSEFDLLLAEVLLTRAPSRLSSAVGSGQ